MGEHTQRESVCDIEEEQMVEPYLPGKMMASQNVFVVCIEQSTESHCYPSRCLVRFLNTRM